jgi:hypothetical protein
VPKDATPGDHLTALIVEQRPDNLKLNQNRRQVVIRYRMAAVFYIKVPQLRRQGSLESLRAEANAEQVVVTPLLKNSGNSVIRPLTSLQVRDSAGVAVAELPQKESLPLLGGAELLQPLVLESRLAPGTYTVKYRVDFQDGSRPTEGVTELIIPQSQRAARNCLSGRPSVAARALEQMFFHGTGGHGGPPLQLFISDKSHLDGLESWLFQTNEHGDLHGVAGRIERAAKRNTWSTHNEQGLGHIRIKLLLNLKRINNLRRH